MSSACPSLLLVRLLSSRTFGYRPLRKYAASMQPTFHVYNVDVDNLTRIMHSIIRLIHRRMRYTISHHIGHAKDVEVDPPYTQHPESAVKNLRWLCRRLWRKIWGSHGVCVIHQRGPKSVLVLVKNSLCATFSSSTQTRYRGQPWSAGRSGS